MRHTTVHDMKRARYIAELVIQGRTLEEIGKELGMHKSTIHTIIHRRLSMYAPDIYESVKQRLSYNLAVRHLRGGEATRLKYAKQNATNPD